LAEAGYAREISFVGSKKLIIENKVKRIPLPPITKKNSKDGNIHLLFSGTLATTTGVFVAIELAAKLHALDRRIMLHIVGFSPLPEVYRDIKNQLYNKPFIHFTVHDQPVHHGEILTEITRSDFGIIAYPPNLSTKNTIPTKLYEYMGYGLPILLIEHPEWAEITNRYHAAVLFDAQAINAEKLLHSMTTEKFYTTQPTEVLWETEEQKLLQAVSTLK
jgi:glycosyltransferase involved in cell wall biosynthesis